MQEKPNPDFIHRFIPSNVAHGTTLLLLHGTGGNENDLIRTAREVAPTTSILSPRGKVLENGMARYFRRLAEGVFDVEDLKFRTDELAAFVKSASRVYNFNSSRVLAFGFSNGANIAASLLFLRPDTLVGAILLRPMVPLIPERLPQLRDKDVLILAGKEDSIVPRKQSEDLRTLLNRAGAEVELQWVQGSHSLVTEDVALARRWFMDRFEKNAQE
jgi:phospholipase/carboxylesterase/glyoxalase family protein